LEEARRGTDRRGVGWRRGRLVVLWVRPIRL